LIQQVTKKNLKIKNVSFAKSIQDVLEKTDLVIIHTEWNDFKSLDFLKLIKNKKIKIYDMRNLYIPSKMTNKNVKYYSVGRG
jgi:UDPglucose 6-dehydrogenase